jgi:hypothetical protein
MYERLRNPRLKISSFYRLKFKKLKERETREGEKRQTYRPSFYVSTISLGLALREASTDP